MIHPRFFLIGGLLVLFARCPADPDSRIAKKSIHIEGKEITHFDRDDASRKAFGNLVYRGGLELSCTDPNFGGISALSVQPDGERFLALSDRAYWFHGRIVYAENRPVSIADAEMTPITGPDGNHAADWDTESVALQGNRLYVGVEDLGRIPFFHFEPETFPCYDGALLFPEGRDHPQNRGLEALAYGQTALGSALIAISEKALDKNGNIKGYLFNSGRILQFTVKRSGNFDISDAEALNDGDLLVLERKYDILSGVSIRLRRIRGSDLKEGAVVDGDTVLEAGMRCQVDNFEAVSAHRDASGKTVLTLMSDDNFSSMQRTLLLQFELRDSPSSEQKK